MNAQNLLETDDDSYTVARAETLGDFFQATRKGGSEEVSLEVWRGHG